MLHVRFTKYAHHRASIFLFGAVMSAQPALVQFDETLNWLLQEDTSQAAACEVRMHEQLTEMSNYESFLRRRDELRFILDQLEGDSREGKAK